MLAPESSPIHQLVAPWWLTTTRPRLWKIPALRESLWEAALGEIRAEVADRVNVAPKRIFLGSAASSRARR